MSSILDQLRQKEAQLASLREKESRRQGREEQLLNQLQTQFGLSTIEEAEEYHKKLEEQLQECNAQLTSLDAEMGQIIAQATPQSEKTNVGNISA